MINYVINLDRRKDRWDTFLDTVDKSIELKKEKFIRISAFDGREYPNEIERLSLEDNTIIKSIEENKITCNKGVLGCYMSHIIALSSILHNEDIKEDDYVGIYEDDVFLCDNFDTRYSEFKTINLKELNIDFLYTGGRFRSNFDRPLGKTEFFEQTTIPNILYRINKHPERYVWDRTTHAYIVKKDKCRDIIDLLSKECVHTSVKWDTKELIAIDNVYSSLHKDIRMFDYIPHLFYSPINFKSDIQLKNKNNI